MLTKIYLKNLFKKQGGIYFRENFNRKNGDEYSRIHESTRIGIIYTCRHYIVARRLDISNDIHDLFSYNSIILE